MIQSLQEGLKTHRDYDTLVCILLPLSWLMGSYGGLGALVDDLLYLLSLHSSPSLHSLFLSHLILSLSHTSLSGDHSFFYKSNILIYICLFRWRNPNSIGWYIGGGVVQSDSISQPPFLALSPPPPSKSHITSVSWIRWKHNLQGPLFHYPVLCDQIRRRSSKRYNYYFNNWSSERNRTSHPPFCNRHWIICKWAGRYLPNYQSKTENLCNYFYCKLNIL